jgi:hypothetical protein
MENKVLLLCPSFFGYENEICAKIREQGHEVDLIIDTPSQKSIIKGFIRLFRPLCQGYLYRILMRKFNQLESKAYTKIIIIKGEYITDDIINKLRELHPYAEFVYYNWDSIKNSRYSTSLIYKVDRAYTFDSVDAKQQPKLQLLPLFFLDEYRTRMAKEPSVYKYDICFIGTARKGRFEHVNSISKANIAKSLYFHVYVQSRLKHFINRMTIKGYNSFDSRYLSFDSLSSVKVKEIIDQSRAVLDIQHPSQSGLTIRTFECLASRKKLITTNGNIREYDFYNKDNIFVLDDKNIEGLNEFLSSPYVKVNEELVEAYSLGNWLKIIIGCDDSRENA